MEPNKQDKPDSMVRMFQHEDRWYRLSGIEVIGNPKGTKCVAVWEDIETGQGGVIPANGGLWDMIYVAMNAVKALPAR